MKKLSCNNCGSNDFRIFGKIIKCEYCGTCYAADNIGDYKYFMESLGFIFEKDNINHGVYSIKQTKITHPEFPDYKLYYVNEFDYFDMEQCLRDTYGKNIVLENGVKLS